MANKLRAIGKMGLVEQGLCGESQSMNIRHANADPARCEVCPLSRIQAGASVRIKRICAAPEVQNRLREIGFGEEQIIRLLTSQTNFICLVCNARLAISEQLAQLILVEPIAALSAD